jgi:scyllo-inositol 2-dehydrogenase (NAD+)
LQIGYLQETPVLIMDKDHGVRHDVVPHFPERFGKAYTAQVEHFVECLTGKAQPRLTPHDARAALQVSLAAFQSQRTGQIVNVAEVT